MYVKHLSHTSYTADPKHITVLNSDVSHHNFIYISTVRGCASLKLLEVEGESCLEALWSLDSKKS